MDQYFDEEILLQFENELFDNDSKYISPQFIRDAAFSSYVEPALKPTDGYIGVDSLNPTDKDIKLKQFYGKRHYNNNDIMSDSLLLSDTDIFFYNTKDDSDPNNNSTKLSFLSGTDYSLFDKAPYVKVTALSGTTSQSYDWVNQNGDIKLTSYELNGTITRNGSDLTDDDSFVCLSPNEEKIIGVPYIFKVFKIKDIEVLGSNPELLNIQWRYSQDNGRTWSKYEPFTKENVTSKRINPIKFFQIEYLVKNESNNKVNIQIYKRSSKQQTI